MKKKGKNKGHNLTLPFLVLKVERFGRQLRKNESNSCLFYRKLFEFFRKVVYCKRGKYMFRQSVCLFNALFAFYKSIWICIPHKKKTNSLFKGISVRKLFFLTKKNEVKLLTKKQK